MRLRLLISFFSLVPLFLLSQTPSPGGITGETLWLKPFVESNNTINIKDHSDFEQKVTVVRSQGFPKLEELNSYPSVKFNKDLLARDLVKLEKKTNVSTSTIIGVFQSEEKTDDKNIVNIEKGTTPEIILSTKQIKKNNGEQDLLYGEGKGHNLIEDSKSGDFIKPRILSYYRYFQPQFSTWGGSSDPRNIIFSNTDPNKNTLKFKGLLAEFIIYDRVLNPTERLKIESYLSIKYGVHLVKDYLDSSAHQIWDYEKNKNFHNRVAGVGRDDVSGLFQLRSTSSYENPVGLLSLSRTYYAPDASCSGCVQYDLQNPKNVTKNEKNTIQKTGSSSWGNAGAYIGIPFKTSGTAVNFEFNQNGSQEVALGLSFTDYDQHWNKMDYALRRASNGNLFWCKSGKCEDLNIKQAKQKFKIAKDNGNIVLYIDGETIKSEPGVDKPLYVDFAIKDNAAKIENLTISTPTITRDFINQEFYLWGDDNGSLEVSKDSGISGLTLLKRTWKVQSSNKGTSSKMLTTVEVDKPYLKSFFPASGDYEYFLIKDSSEKGDFSQIGNVKFYPAQIFPTSQNEKFLAHEVDWGTTANEAFTIGYTNTFLASVTSENPNCAQEKGKVSLELLTGKNLLPIEYELKNGGKVIANGSITNANDKPVIEDVPDGESSLVLTANNGKKSEYTVDIKIPNPIVLNIPNRANITSEGFVEIDASQGQLNPMTYQWTGPNNFAYNGPVANITSIGRYTVTANYGQSCSVSKSIDITQTNIKKIEKYPVPVRIGEELIVKVQLYKPEAVTLDIYNMLGVKIYSKKRRVNSTNHTFNLTLSQPGVHKAVVTTTADSMESFSIKVE